MTKGDEHTSGQPPGHAEQDLPDWALRPTPRKLRKRPPILLIYLLGILGGLLGAAVVMSLSFAPWCLFLPLLSFVMAGPLEELCKPIIVVLLLERRPYWLRTRVEVVVLMLMSALSFATLENILYVYVRFPDLAPSYAAYRFGVCTSIHMITSTILGLGLVRTGRSGRMFRGVKPGRFLLWYGVAAAIHTGYNCTVVFLQYIGLMPTWQ